MSSSHLIPGFTRLSSTTSLYVPTLSTTFANGQGNTTNATASLAPLPASQQCDLVIICAWANALPKHIAKYTTAYQHLMPYARILVLESAMGDLIYRSHASQRASLQSALDVVAATQKHSNDITTSHLAKTHGIFLHIFSNGGINAAVQLTSAMQDRGAPPLRPRAMLIDSAPSRGNDTYAQFMGAMRATIPANLHLLAWPILVLVYAYFWTMQACGMELTMVANARRLLDIEELVPQTTPVGFVYSEMDQVVAADDVRWYASKVKQQQNRKKVLEWCADGKHVGHMAKDPVRYWTLVGHLLS